MEQKYNLERELQKEFEEYLKSEGFETNREKTCSLTGDRADTIGKKNEEKYLFEYKNGINTKDLYRLSYQLTNYHFGCNYKVVVTSQYHPKIERMINNESRNWGYWVFEEGGVTKFIEEKEENTGYLENYLEEIDLKRYNIINKSRKIKLKKFLCSIVFVIASPFLIVILFGELGYDYLEIRRKKKNGNL